MLVGKKLLSLTMEKKMLIRNFPLFLEAINKCFAYISYPCLSSLPRFLFKGIVGYTRKLIKECN